MPQNEDAYKKYDASEIERYYKGQMSQLERHQLERAALEDPFLADALEGYAVTEHPTEDATYLQGQLQERIGASKVVVLKKRSAFSVWMRIAAMMVILAGSGWLVYQVAKPDAQTEIAQKRKSPNAAENTLADTIGISNQETTQTPANATAAAPEQRKENSAAKELSRSSKAESNQDVATQQASDQVETFSATSDSVAVFKEQGVEPEAVPSAASARKRQVMGKNALDENDATIADSINISTAGSNTTIRFPFADKSLPRFRFENAEPTMGWKSYGNALMQQYNRINQTPFSEKTIADFSIAPDGTVADIQVQPPVNSNQTSLIRFLLERTKWRITGSKGRVEITNPKTP